MSKYSNSFFSGFLCILFILTFTNSLFAQKQITKENLELLRKEEKVLVNLADSLRFALIPDDRKEYCAKFVKHLKETLEITGSYYYNFDSLATRIHVLSPEDKSFKLFNWLLITSEFSKFYYAAIQKPSDDLILYPLFDYSEKIEDDALSHTLDSKHWFGCEYYRIMKDDQAGQPVYLLFGFSSKSISSNKKLVDVLSFDDMGSPVFGSPIFYLPNENERGLVPQHRLVLEFKKGVPVSLNYDSNYKMIMFNHLTSEIEDPKRKGTYIPTGRIDGLRKENGQWIYVRDAIPVLKLDDGQAPIDGVMR